MAILMGKHEGPGPGSLEKVLALLNILLLWVGAISRAPLKLFKLCSNRNKAQARLMNKYATTFSAY